MRPRLFALALFVGSILPAGFAGSAVPEHPNILLIIVDDVSAGMIGAYHGGSGHPHTPTIDGLAQQGVMFRNAWSNPVCATTRSTIQTGRYAHRTGIYGATGFLNESEQVIPEVIAAQNYKSALVGKWGLAGSMSIADATLHPVRAGYDRFAGNPYAAYGYFSWDRRLASFHSSCNPVSHQNNACIDTTGSGTTSTYSTTAHVFDAAGWVTAAHQNPSTHKPWFIVLAFNAAHTTFHRPQDAIHDLDEEFEETGALEQCDPDEESLCYHAMIEAMDNQLGALLTWLDQDFDADSESTTELAKTIVIFVGDNGTPRQVAPDEDRAKFTLFQGGINVPLIVKGPGVAASGGSQPRVSNALVNTSDLFMTVRELSGSTTALSADHDSYSLVPVLTGASQGIRHFAYSEVDGPHMGKAIRNRNGLKLQRSNEAGVKWFAFDLANDPGESTNLVDPNGETPELVTSNPELQAQVDELADLLGEATLTSANPPEPDLPAANLDGDADGVANTADHCSEVGQDLTQRCDTDQDGYGNLCDGDFDNDGFTFPSDWDLWYADFLTGVDSGERGTDMNCDGFVDSADFPLWTAQAQGAAVPGPSGLLCAGQQPCVVP